MMRALGQLACGIGLFVASLLVYIDFRGLISRYERYADRSANRRTRVKSGSRVTASLIMCIAGIVVVQALYMLVKKA
jgi:hypothetical protein